MSGHRVTMAARERRAIGEEGSILVWALLFVIITSAMIVSHSTYLDASRRGRDVRHHDASLATTYARAGLTDALSWYQRQATQPVTDFAPRYEPDGDPPLADTLDPSLGLVREFEVRGDLWARYEVRLDDVFDVSAERGHSQAGRVWDVGSRGILYRRRDPDLPYDQGDNRVIAATHVRTEMQGIAVVPPAPAAVAVEGPGRLDLGPNAQVDGSGGAAVASPTGAAPGLLRDATVSGTPAAVAVPGYDAEARSVFGMSLSHVRSLCDYVLGEADGLDALSRDGGRGGDGNFGQLGGGGDDDDDCRWRRHRRVRRPFVPAVDSLPVARERVEHPLRRLLTRDFELSPLASTNYENASWEWLRTRYAPGAGQLRAPGERLRLMDRAVFVRGDLRLVPDQPLLGRALVVVDGDLVVEEGNKTLLSGMVYVTGNARIDGCFVLQGVLVVRGDLRMGYGSEPSVVRYDPAALDALKRALERYRLSRSIRPGWGGPR